MVEEMDKNPYELKIHEARAAIQAGALTSLHLVNSCLERIDRFEESIHAWAVVDRERALEHAHLLDLEHENGQGRGPLHGIPLGIQIAGPPQAENMLLGVARWCERTLRIDLQAPF